MKKVFVAIPCMEDVPIDFVKSLTRLRHVGHTSINFSVGSLIYASRDYLAECAIREKADYIVWFDSDMVFRDDFLIDMIDHLESGKDFVCGLYHRRKPPFSPCIFKTIRMGIIPEEAVTENYDDHPETEPFKIDACGFGGVAMKVSMLEDVLDKQGQMFTPMAGYGEDIAFCIRARKVGYDLWCDPKLEMGHIAKTVATKETFKRWRETEAANGPN